MCAGSHFYTKILCFSPFKPWWCWWRWKFWSIFWFWCAYTSQWLYSNHFLPAYYKHRRAIYISHRVPHWPRFQRPVKLCWCLYISLSFPHLSHLPLFSLCWLSLPSSFFSLPFQTPCFPPSPSCVWGSSIGYTGFYFSFSKKSAVEAHESPLKDVHRPTGGIHPPTPFFVVCHVYSCSLILDPNGNTDFPRVSHVFHFYVCIRTR